MGWASATRVVNRIAPESHIIDLSHGIPPLDVPAPANAAEGLGVASGDLVWLSRERG